MESLVVVGLPGARLALEHRLRDIDRQARAVGMCLNVKKTNLLVINPKHNLQAVPFVSIEDGDPLPVVSELRLLGMVFDEELSWWPLTNDLVRRCNAKIS